MNDIFIEECRNDLLQMNGSDSTIHNMSKTRSTKTDNKLKANLSIKELLNRLGNFASELERLHNFFLLMLKYTYKRRKTHFVVGIK